MCSQPPMPSRSIPMGVIYSTIIFTALASLTVSYEDVKDDVKSLNDGMKGVQSELHELSTAIKVSDAADQGKKAVWMAIVAFLSGGLGLALIKWILDTYLNGGL
jgi:hypothetical protein